MTPPADFIAFMEFLIRRKLTRIEKAGLRGLAMLPQPDPRPWEIVLVE